MNDKFYYANGHEIEPHIVQFYSSDSEVNYTKNQEHHQDELDNNGWSLLSNGEYPYNPENPALLDSVPLNYRFNKYGFRGVDFPEYKTPRSVITLGCNDTLGIGMPESLIWPTLISNTLKWRAINLALENTSFDTQYRLLLAWLPKIQSQYVFCLEPTDACREEIVENEYRSEIYPAEMREYYDINRDKNLRAMENLCDKVGAKFVYLPRNVWNFHENQDYARDLAHSGRKSHIYITYQMLKKAGVYD